MGGVSLRRPHAIDKKVKFNEASTVGSEGTQDAVRENGVWHHQHGVPPPQPNNEYRSWVMAGQAGMIRGARNIDTISGADGRFDISSGLRASQSESRIQEPQMSQRRESAEAADTATGGRPHLFTNQNNNALHLSLTPETHPIRNAAPPSNDEESHSSQTSGSTPRSNFMALIEEAIQYKDAGSSEYNNILRRLATDPPRKSMLVLLKQERGGWRHDHIDMDRDLTVGDVINGMTMLLSPEGEERSWELIRTALQDTETWRRFYDE
ncbi:hypothetical protein H0H87_008638 [Tephrocybe sp. NHM501043]|nr:hypothetical protein H0H87_008638 [Tephrocybe sp. NHM501043]